MLKQDEKLELGLKLGLSEKEAGIIKEVMGPELNAKHARRSNTAINIKNTTLLINIKAQDASAFRAAANSILNSIILTKSILEVEKW